MFSSRKPPCQDALRLAVVARTSVIRVLLAFRSAPECAHNLLLKRGCCHFAQAIGVTSDPRITFPYLLKICASTLGLCAAPAPFTRPRHHSPSTASASPSNPRRARRTVVAPPLAISSIGAFRTPAVGACG